MTLPLFFVINSKSNFPHLKILKNCQLTSLYVSYELELQAILNDIICAPKGTNIGKTSDAFNALANAVSDFAELTEEKESIRKRIKVLIKEGE